MNKKNVILLILLTLLTACTPNAPAPTTTSTPIPTPQPTATLKPTDTPTPSPTTVPTQIDLKNTTHHIIEDAYLTYYENKDKLTSHNLPSRTQLIDMSPHEGIYWPYLVYEPKEIRSKNVLVRIPNSGNPNFEDDDEFLKHLLDSIGTIQGTIWEADEIGSILLVPVFPRFSIPHTFGSQYLSRFTLDTEYIELKDVDLQLILMAKNVIQRYEDKDISLSKRMLFTGYSAESWFSSRFTALNPEHVQAVSIGGCAWPTVSIKSFDEFELDFPIGLADIEEYERILPNQNDFQKVYVYIYLGSMDGYTGTDWGWDFGPITDGLRITDFRNPNRPFFMKFGMTSEELFNSNNKMLTSIKDENLKMELLLGLDHSETYEQNYKYGVAFLKEHAEYF